MPVVRRRPQRLGATAVLGLLALAVLVAPVWLRSDVELAGVWAGLEARPLAHDWQLVEGKHWQIVSTAVEDVEVTDALEATRGECPPGMVEISGRMKQDPRANPDGIEELQNAACVEWINRDFPERCARFDPERWSELSRDLETAALRYCIDRFEYPNRRGAYPWIMVSWREAQELCGQAGKRLCSEREWTFACEGEEALPYPNGYERDREACTIDRAWRLVDANALALRDGPRALHEVDRLWQGEVSGARTRCRSPFGVYDMTGNVDEWTTSARPGERPSIFKGGYWGPVRARCRPATRAHDEDFVFYQEGFRCCADAPPAPGGPSGL